MRAIILVCALAIGSSGCAAAPDDDVGSAGPTGVGGSSGGAGSGTGGAGSSSSGGWPGMGGASSTGGSGGNLGLGGGASGGASAGGGGAPGGGGAFGGNEAQCDGVDNDQNGIIDDVDKGKDGICDCLKIATLGVKGKYGQGDVFAAWLAARSDFGAVALGVQDLTPALLAPYEVIVAQDLSAAGGVFGSGGYTASEVSALEAWVKGGGGLMTLTGYEDAWSNKNVNILMAPFGMSYGSQQILYNSGSTVGVSQWVPHPVTTGVSLIGVGNGYPVVGPGQVLASQSGFNVLQALTTGSGRILMWGDEWITYNSEWTTAPQYQVELFWVNAIKWLSPADQCQVPIPPGIK